MRALLTLFAALSLFHGSNTAVASKVETSIVRIAGMTATEGDESVPYICTGFVIGKNRVMSAAHCLGNEMTVDGAPVAVLRFDPNYDLSLLDVKTSKPALSFSDVPLTRFQELTAIGYAFGWDALYASPERVILIDHAPIHVATPGIIVQPGLIPGMSGGPLVDAKGKVVGVNLQTNRGVGYSIGVVIIRAFLVGV